MSCKNYSSSSIITVNDINVGECISMSSGNEGYYSVEFPPGRFLVELWGASGGSSFLERLNSGGKGGYTSGILSIEQKTSFFFFIGTQGGNAIGGTPGPAGYNGGAKGAIDNTNDDCASGGSGGASDMRLNSGSWNSDESLLSRIMVAGGGGSAGCYIEGGSGGQSGGILGGKGSDNDSGSNKGGDGGSQIKGYSLGSGEQGMPGDEASGSGGGGYWGGYKGMTGARSQSGGGGGGGSSFVSGFQGCFAMDSNKKPLLNSTHPSNIYFKTPNIISGNSSIPSFENPKLIEESGHQGNGCARITFLKGLSPFKLSCSHPFGFNIYYQFMVLFTSSSL